ncbi:hypothetical protein ETAA8_55400 [Anatilimnocola aggregata]|uniref:Uncharacterized protein n=1 Tax=Anatilimnocola aggregata TaxID=2528021 RepID=A0A517YJK4_9BACT|nr:hypothetical protein [Anatilimnocola aggregata]QDU30400.1 hypothetical protein ETAA8_55400 [Anatilimnocola aggregata]
MNLPRMSAASFLVVTFVWCNLTATLLGQTNPTVERPVSIGRTLPEFGPVAKPTDLQETYNKAVEALRATGGLLVVPAEAWKQLKQHPAQQGLVRLPSSPAETKQWREGPGVTIITADEKQTIIHVPPLSGLRMEREMRLEDGDSVPHWGTHPMLQLKNDLIYGSVSYLDWIQTDVEKGLDRKFYVPTVRGLVPGQFINVHGHSGYGGGVTRANIKGLGYDADKKLHYFIADTSIDHKAGAIAHNKSNTGLIHMIQNSNADNQTYDVKVIRNQYAHGDTYIYYCDFNYMSNVHSAAGDENGNCFAAFIRSKDNNFRSSVDSFDPVASRLVFGNSASNIETLGNSRPLINLNPAKHITKGKVLIVPGRSEFDQPDAQMSIFEGKNYGTSLIKNPITNSTERKFGGLIRGDKDCPWDQSVVGRYFAVDDKSERTPKGNYRWYLITAFRQNGDGTKEIEIQRFWWGAKSAGSPTLYRNENYTWDGHERPLGYIIAPGAYVNDVSRAIVGGDRGGQRTLGLAPSSDQASNFAFEKGDKLEQAIGPDPFKPEAMRVWMWEDVPGQYPAAVLDVANHGAVSRYSVISVAGGPANLDDLAKRHEPKPAWDNIFVVNTAATVGMNLKADFANAAILFQQPNREQALKWHFGMPPKEDATAATSTGNARPMDAKPAPKEASLTVSRETGEFQLAGGGLNSGGAVSGVAGLSGDDRAAMNLRGKNLVVAGEATTLKVKFPRPEADGDYAVFLELSWLTERAVSDKTAEGFTVTFAKPAPANAKLDWMIVR